MTLSCHSFAHNQLWDILFILGWSASVDPCSGFTEISHETKSCGAQNDTFTATNESLNVSRHVHALFFFLFKSEDLWKHLKIKWVLSPSDNAQRLIAMQSNILYETVNEGLWGISSQGIRYETCNSVNLSLSLSLSLYMKSHWSPTKEQLQIRSTKALLWELQSELMSIDTLSHSVPPEPQLHCDKQSNQTKQSTRIPI